MKKHFLTGLVILLPLAVTLFLVGIIINFVTKPFMGFVTKLFSGVISSPLIIHYLSQIIIIFLFLFLTIGLGVLARMFFFNTLMLISDKIVQKIPIINKVYKTIKDIIKTVFVTDKNSFKQVVLARFPSSDVYSVGLISSASPKTCSDALKSDLLTVFIPTTPNPTTGFLLMCKKEDLIFLDGVKTEDAIKYIVSCGVILPEVK